MEVPMTLLHCCECGMPYMIPTGRVAQLKSCHNTFFCPSGHPQWYPRPKVTEEDRLRKQLIEKDREIELLKSKKRKKK